MSEDAKPLQIDNLKVTILRATRPGDIVFFSMPESHVSHRDYAELALRLKDILKNRNVTAVVLPETLSPVGAITPFEFPDPTAPDPIKDRADTAERVLQAVETWRAEHQPTCAEALHQVDRNVEEAPALAETLLNIAGYHPRE